MGWKVRVDEIGAVSLVDGKGEIVAAFYSVFGDDYFPFQNPKENAQKIVDALAADRHYRRLVLLVYLGFALWCMSCGVALGMVLQVYLRG